MSLARWLTASSWGPLDHLGLLHTRTHRHTSWLPHILFPDSYIQYKTAVIPNTDGQILLMINDFIRQQFKKKKRGSEREKKWVCIKRLAGGRSFHFSVCLAVTFTWQVMDSFVYCSRCCWFGLQVHGKVTVVPLWCPLIIEKWKVVFSQNVSLPCNFIQVVPSVILSWRWNKLWKMSVGSKRYML